MKNEQDFSFGRLLRELRLEKNLSQSALAAMLQTSQDTVSLWEKDKSLPDFIRIKKLAEIFDVSTDYLFGLKDY